MGLVAVADDRAALAGLAVLASLAVLAGLAAARAEGEDVTRAAPGAATEKRPGILAGLDPAARAAALRLDALAQAAGLPALTWTSGRRSTAEQAAAMLAKVARGENLRDLYRSAGATLDRLYDAPRTVAAWAAVLDASPPLSLHLAGRALDVRRWGMTAAELYRLGELAIEAGWGRALLESDHLHLQL